METYRKKLIEVALPLEAINEASRREKNPFTKHHPRALHVWWARRPLAACRAVLFASLVDDPSSVPEGFPAEEAQEKERQRLFRIIEKLVKWESTTNEEVLHEARLEIARSVTRDKGQEFNPKMTREQCVAFLQEHAPPVLDPFCGGGSIPLEAQRLGLRAYASDLNPVAVLITKALIEIPPKFANKSPVNPDARKQQKVHAGGWKGAQGLAEDVRYYGQWMRDEAEKRIGHLYPKARLPPEIGGGEATVVAWLWARTVKCPNPACGAQMPLVRSFALSTKKGKEAWVAPIVNKGAKTVKFAVQTDGDPPTEGTVNRRGATCLVCETPVPLEHARSESREGRMGTVPLAIVAEGQRGRVYLAPDPQHAKVAEAAQPSFKPDGEIADNPGHTNVYRYGLTTWGDLFTSRQLVALTTFSDLVTEAHERVLLDAKDAMMHDSGPGLSARDAGATAYADAVTTYLALATSRFSDFSNAICSWDSGNTNMRQLFSRQAIPMAWDFAETNPLKGVVNVFSAIEWVALTLEHLITDTQGFATQLDAVASFDGVQNPIVVTDPPYYDNIGYADLSDFFYVWLRRSLGPIFPDLFSTLLVPKSQELVATPFRFEGDKDRAKTFFEQGLAKVFSRMREAQHPGFPLAVYYAFKQAETDSEGEIDAHSMSVASSGWETILEGLLGAGFSITGTWPMRTEQQQRSVAAGTNALASSIVLVCRSRSKSASLATRRDFVAALKRELSEALKVLQHGNVAPVDLAQAAIGPGMAVFTRHARILEADGTPMSVRTALQIINQELDAYLAAQEGEMDGDTRFCLTWFDQHGMLPGPFGEADVLARAKNTSAEGMVRAGVLTAKGGQVTLIPRSEYPSGWDPLADTRFTLWECTQHLIKRHQEGGEAAAAALVARLGPGRGEEAKTLAYRLYAICERKGWTQEALAYNEFVVAWPEILKKTVAITGEGPQKTLIVEEKE